MKLNEIFKRLLCKHKSLVFVRNIYGDEINRLNGHRSEWICKDCGKTIYKDTLNKVLTPIGE